MEIASRILKIREGQSERQIPIRIFAPEKTKDASWSCRYEIDWPGEKREMTAFGVDAVQAILLAMELIGAELYTSTYHKAGALFFNRPGSGYGFPVAQSLRDQLVGDDANFL